MNLADAACGSILRALARRSRSLAPAASAASPASSAHNPCKQNVSHGQFPRPSLESTDSPLTQSRQRQRRRAVSSTVRRMAPSTPQGPLPPPTPTSSPPPPPPSASSITPGPFCKKTHPQPQTEPQQPQKVELRRTKARAKHLAEDRSDDVFAPILNFLTGSSKDANVEKAASTDRDDKGGWKHMDPKRDVKTDDVSLTFEEKPNTACSNGFWLEGTAGKAAKSKASKLTAAHKVIKVKKKMKVPAFHLVALPTTATSEDETHPKKMRTNEKDTKEMTAVDAEMVLMRNEEKQDNQKTEGNKALSEANEISISTKTNSFNEIFVASKLYSSGSDGDRSNESDKRRVDKLKGMDSSTDGKVERPKVETGEEQLEEIIPASAPSLNIGESENTHPDPLCPSLTCGTSCERKYTISVTVECLKRKNQNTFEDTPERISPLQKQEKPEGVSMGQQNNLHVEITSNGDTPLKSSTFSIAEKMSSRNISNTSLDVPSISDVETSFENKHQETVKMKDGVRGNGRTHLSSDVLLSNQGIPTRETEKLIHLDSEFFSLYSSMENLKDVCFSLRDILDDPNISDILGDSSNTASDDKVFDWSEMGEKITHLSDCKSEPDIQYSKPTAFNSLSEQELSFCVSAKKNKKTKAVFNEDKYNFVIGDCNFDVQAKMQQPIHLLIADLLKEKEFYQHDREKSKDILFDDYTTKDEAKLILTLDQHEIIISNSETAISCASSDFFENTLLLIPPSSSDEDTSISTDVSSSLSKTTPSTSAAELISWPQTTTCSISDDANAPFLSRPGLAVDSSGHRFVSANLEDLWCHTGRLESAERLSTPETPQSRESVWIGQHEDSNRECNSCSSSHSNLLGVVKNDPMSQTSWVKMTSCSESHSTAYVFVTSSSSEGSTSSSPSTSSIDSADDISSSEFFSVGGAADGKDCVLTEDQVALKVTSDHGCPTEVVVSSDPGSADSPSPPATSSSSATETVCNGATSSIDAPPIVCVAGTTEGGRSSDESSVTEEDVIAMALEYCNVPSCTCSDVSETSLSSPPRISSSCMGRTWSSVTAVVASPRRSFLAPDLVSDLPEGCSAGPPVTSGRREARHRRRCDKPQRLPKRAMRCCWDLRERSDGRSRRRSWRWRRTRPARASRGRG